MSHEKLKTNFKDKKSFVQCFIRQRRKINLGAVVSDPDGFRVGAETIWASTFFFP